jgi:hypothetical protein
VVITADAADTAGDEVRVTRIFTFHENAVPTKNGRSAVALGNFLGVEVNLGKDAEAANDAGNRVPVHFYEIL